MNGASPIMPATSTPAPAPDAAHSGDGAVRERIARLFRKCGDGTEVRALEQAVLAYRLEQQR
jgi:hypothetical protein